MNPTVGATRREFKTALRALAASAVCAGLVLIAPAPAWAQQPEPVKQGKWFEHVLIIVLENNDYKSALKNDYLKKLAARGSLFSAFSARFQPSQPNYLAMIAGQTFGVDSNNVTDVDGKSVADLLEAKGLSWKQYAQGYPGACSRVGQDGDYVRKHVPFISFKSIQNDPARCANIVAADAFDPAHLPNFAFYSPDNRNDGHDTQLEFAAHWLQDFLEPMLNNPQTMKDTLIIVTFDESDSRKDDRVYTVFLGDAVRPGYISTRPVDHYALLRTIEDNFALGSLGQGDARASAITDVWIKP